MRKYTVTDIKHADKDYFYHNGQKYQRLHIGGSIFDIKVAGQKEIDEFRADAKLWRTNKKAYFKKHQV